MKILDLGRLRPLAFGAALAVLACPLAMSDIPPPTPDATPAVTPETTPAPSEAPVDPAAAKAEALKIKASDIGLGDPNAPVKWIEYASTGCPHCADLTLKVLPALKAEYIDSGKVYYVLRDFPLDNVAASASVIARCLPADKFYPFVDKLFATQPTWHGPDATDPKSVLLGLAAEQGLDEAGVEACFKRQELLDQLINGLKEAETALGVASTPTSFIGDETVVGTVSVEEFKKTLDKALGVPTAEGQTPVPEATPEQSTPATSPAPTP